MMRFQPFFEWRTPFLFEMTIIDIICRYNLYNYIIYKYHIFNDKNVEKKEEKILRLSKHAIIADFYAKPTHMIINFATQLGLRPINRPQRR